MLGGNSEMRNGEHQSTPPAVVQLDASESGLHFRLWQWQSWHYLIWFSSRAFQAPDLLCISAIPIPLLCGEKGRYVASGIRRLTHY